MDMAYVYLIIGCCVLAFFISGILADRYALRKHYKINLDRYNFVVGMLDQDQQKQLHEYYIETGVLKTDK